jgi:hypothetical protein
MSEWWNYDRAKKLRRRRIGMAITLIGPFMLILVIAIINNGNTDPSYDDPSPVASEAGE